MQKTHILAHVLPLAMAGCLWVSPAGAQEAHIAPITELVNAKLKQGLSDPAVVAAIKAQNAANAAITQADIDARDKQWRSEVEAGGGEMIETGLNSPASNYLKTFRDDAGGMITEVFVMDAHGLNVAQSDPTSDYWQGDEDKYQQTYSVGPRAVHVSEIEFDESSQTYQVQISITLNDPATGAPIGAMTVGIDAEALM